MSKYLIAAKEKRNSDKGVDYDLSLRDFICQCYVKLAPNTYGKKIEKYLENNLRGIKVPTCYERGDLLIARKYFELKVSYLSQENDSYSITHLRPWQNFDYYLLCFVDCDDDFKPHFYVIDKFVASKLTIGYMNGTPKSNKDNSNIEMRATVKRYSDNFDLIVAANKLKDTTYQSLLDFIKELRMKSQIISIYKECE